MMKQILILLAIAAILVGCEPKQFIVNGIVENKEANGKMACLNEEDSRIAIDSVLIVDGKFAFTREANPDQIYSVTIKEILSRTIFIGEEGVITVVANEYAGTGTKLNDGINKFVEELNEANTSVQTEFKAAFEQEPARIGEFREIYSKKSKAAAHKVRAKWFNNNIKNPLGLISLVQLSANLNLQELDSLIALVGPAASNYPQLKPIRAQKAKVYATSVGRMFTDFTGKAMDGSVSRLSDYVGNGKYVLVDYWASWCGPCIAEVPNLLEIHKMYNKKGLDIVGIAVWDKFSNIEKALKEEKLPWPQIFEGTGVSTDAYGIKTIPQIMLFAPDGTVIARDLRGLEMKAKIKEVMSR